jgi:hypothetical protein
MTVIPIYQQVSSKYTIDIELNGVLFTLLFYWNSRDTAWYMSIYSGEVPILTGIKLVPQYLLLNQYRSLPNLPNGDFFIVDNDKSGGQGSITYDNIGLDSRFSLVFLTSEELENGI